MTARTLRRLRHLALRALRRTARITTHRAPAPPRHGCAPPCGDRFLA
ncbi:hypothetical protein OG582_38640 (plasmid) [Streptomyces anulatus]|nr:hypothetical protein [Streptomyces anulatus]MCX4523589.1 hypothetical protein [Streptomyces anulatus]MCX4523718.1 hypothetical protein [Streptomyces anulatus]WTD15404.1 hypothetical protein OHA54_39780 [Streptomyces anulatus]WTD30585.1 hypothetical protein OH737_39110 [Streptomyces anulatus]WTE08543.1 hypothetical protein OH765_38955 [Streptomyces anulatus]